MHGWVEGWQARRAAAPAASQQVPSCPRRQPPAQPACRPIPAPVAPSHQPRQPHLLGSLRPSTPGSLRGRRGGSGLQGTVRGAAPARHHARCHWRQKGRAASPSAQCSQPPAHAWPAGNSPQPAVVAWRAAGLCPPAPIGLPPRLPPPPRRRRHVLPVRLRKRGPPPLAAAGLASRVFVSRLLVSWWGVRGLAAARFGRCLLRSGCSPSHCLPASGSRHAAALVVPSSPRRCQGLQNGRGTRRTG